MECVVVETGGDRPVVGQLDLVAARARGFIGKAALRERPEQRERLDFECR